MQAKWQMGINKTDKYLGVAEIGKPDIIQVVMFHKLIENIGTQNHCLGDINAYVSKPIEHPVSFHNSIQESQSTGFSTNGSFTDTRKTDVFVKSLPIELGNYTTGFI